MCVSLPADEVDGDSIESEGAGIMTDLLSAKLRRAHAPYKTLAASSYASAASSAVP